MAFSMITSFYSNSFAILLKPVRETPCSGLSMQELPADFQTEFFQKKFCSVS